MKRNPKQMITKEVIERVSKLMLSEEHSEGLINYIMEIEPLAYTAMLDLVDAFVANTSYFLPNKDVELLYAFIGASFFTGYLLSRESLLPLDEIEKLAGDMSSKTGSSGIMGEYDSYIDKMLNEGKSYKEIGNHIRKVFKGLEKKYITKTEGRKANTKKVTKSSKKLPKDGLDFSL